MMRASVYCLLAASLACQLSWGDVLDEIAPAAVVCVGMEAQSEERQAAKLIFRTLRERSDSAQLLSDEQVLGTPVTQSGKWHVVAVGRPTTNRVLLAYPSYWALNRELHYAPLGHMPAAPFTETRGFYVGGFGYFFAGRNVGFVEFDRSPFYSDTLFSLPAEKKASHRTAPPLRFLIRITGSTPNGVLLGAKRFLETRMLYGLAIGLPRWPRSHDLWNLDDENIPPDPPDWIPKGRYRGSGKQANNKTVSFLGWLMADRLIYAGFLEITGCKPVQMWRVKYQTEVGLLDFNRSPHHRASVNELLIVRLSKRKDVAKALKGLGGRIRMTIGRRTCYRTMSTPSESEGEQSASAKRGREKFLVDDPSPTFILSAAIGGEPYLILANFATGHMDVIVREVIRSLPEE